MRQNPLSESTTPVHTASDLAAISSSPGGDATYYWPTVRSPHTQRDPWDKGSLDVVSDEITPIKDRIVPLIRTSFQSTSPRRFQILQQWEGIVTELDSEWFSADLRDLTNPQSALEVAEFPIQTVSPADRDLLAVGCVFYWVLGYETRAGGQILQTSEIRVRRAPRWTLRTLEAAKTRARSLFQLESEDEQNSPAASEPPHR